MYKVKQYKYFTIVDTKVGKMLLNTKDKYIGRNLIFKGTWEPHIYPIFLKYIKKGDCVLDIGANNGCHSIVFSKIVGQEGSVHSFEPLREIFFQLKFNTCLLYTSPSPRDPKTSRMPSSA